jgi:hypothetical protein
VSYIVWIQGSSYEGYYPSDPLDTLAQCLEHIITNTYGSEKYVVTTPVEVDLVEKKPSLGKKPTLVFPPGARMATSSDGLHTDDPTR